MERLTGSVGKGGKNQPEDVRTVQDRLNFHASAAGYAKVKATGECGNDTVKAILAFQAVIGLKRQDGRVDPGGATLKALSDRKLPAAQEDNAGPAGAKKPGKLSGKTSGVAKDVIDFAEGVAAFYGRDIVVTSGKRSAQDQADAMWTYWTTNLKRGKRYRFLQSNTSLQQELDQLYVTGNEDRTKSSKEKTEAEKKFKEMVVRNAEKLSLHLAGRAIDIRKSCMTELMRAAMRTGLHEIDEDSCWHYDNANGKAPAVTDALRKKWKAP